MTTGGDIPAGSRCCRNRYYRSLLTRLPRGVAAVTLLWSVVNLDKAKSVVLKCAPRSLTSVLSLVQEITASLHSETHVYACWQERLAALRMAALQDHGRSAALPTSALAVDRSSKLGA